MTVGEGQFLLYSYITPALKAGDYRFDVAQTMTAKKGTHAVAAGEVPIAPLQTYVNVTAPRYSLPPDQVLSTFPPAGSEGAYGSRLPQIVIKRRTLPWERGLTMPDGHGGQVAVDEKTPWLALVLIAEGEAELRLNQDVATCVTAGVVLEGTKDVAKANCLVVRQSILEKILPSRKDVPLLAHAREVDIHDTELMMGDDDGFLAVVISNRLPVGGTDANGHDVPVKYLACLINLEGQFHRLIPEAPPPTDTFRLYSAVNDRYVAPAVYDHVAGGGLVQYWGQEAVDPGDVLSQVGQLSAVVETAGPEALALGEAHTTGAIHSLGIDTSAHTSATGYTAFQQHDIYTAMASDFTHAGFVFAEPELVFPVLLHWSFTSTGSTTFETLMRGLDSHLFGGVPEHPADPAGRPPLEVVETGHVGLTHRTRRGDTVKTWYRGPLLAHPSSGERLPIAHASDQLRAVIPDGREDISLAAAFEVGRLLALSRPAMVAALLRWRQVQFQVARAGAIWEQVRDQLPFAIDEGVRFSIESKLRTLIAQDPDQFIGAYRSPVTPGDPVDWGADPLRVLQAGFGIKTDLAKMLRSVGDITRVVGRVRGERPPIAGGLRADGQLTSAMAALLQESLDSAAEQLVSNVLANEIAVDPVLGAGIVRTPDIGTIITRPGVPGSILHLPGGILDVHVDPGEPVRPPRPRRSRRNTSAQRSDPLDELLHGAEHDEEERR